MTWILLTYHLPAEPSRHRVAVWRELRKAGAISLQQATWAMPDRHDFVETLSRAVGLIELAGGDALAFDAAPRGDAIEARLEELFTAERTKEWREFLAECVKFEEEIAKEIRIAKFTSAELDEEEQNLERLARWFRDLRRRDVFVATAQDEAEQRLKECGELLDDYARRVYEFGDGK